METAPLLDRWPRLKIPFSQRLRPPLPPEALLLALAFCALATWLAVVEYQTFNVYHRDFAIYRNVLWNTAANRPFETTLLQLNTSHLAEHVAPSLVPLALLYGLIPDPRGLIVLQQAALAAAGLPVYLLARVRLGGRLVPLAVLLGFYLTPLLSEIAYNKFHPVALAAVPIGFGAYFILSGRSQLGALVGSSTVLVEETSALALLGLGLLLLLQRRPRLAALVGGFAAAWLALMALLVMPAFHLEETLPQDGNRTTSKFRLLRTDPSELGALLQERAPVAAEWWLLPNAGLALLSPATLAASLPTAAVLALLDDSNDLRTHRAAPLVPLLWLASVQSLAALRDGFGRLRAPTSASRSWRLRLALAALLACALGASLLDSRLPGGGRFNPDQIRWDARSDALQRAVDAVPPEAAVVGTLAAAEHLADRDDVWVFPFSRVRQLKPNPGQVDWWLYDMDQRDDVVEDLSQERVNPLRAGPAYSLWLVDHHLLVATAELPEPPQEGTARFAGQLRLRAYGLRWTDRGLGVQLAWRAIRRPDQDYRRHLEILNSDGTILASQDGPATFDFVGASKWQAEQVVVEDFVVPIDPGTAPSRLRLSWLDPSTQAPLRMEDAAEHLELVLPPR